MHLRPHDVAWVEVSDSAFGRMPSPPRQPTASKEGAKVKRSAKPKYAVDLVVAFRARGEILFRYGRIHANLGTIYDYREIPERGWRIACGSRFFEVPISAMRPLTSREIAPRKGKRK